MKRQSLLISSVVLLGTLSMGGPLTSSAAVPGSSTTPSHITVTVTSGRADGGSVEVTTISLTFDYGTCTAPKQPGSTSCTFTVPARTSVVVLARPGTRDRLDGWKKACAATPGDVCFVWTDAPGTTRTATVTLSKAPLGAPRLSASSLYVQGSGPDTCDPDKEGDVDSVVVSATGLPANTAASLTDDGAVVASGTTTATGGVSLQDGPGPSEPGIYRTVAITAGDVTVSGDVINETFNCVQTKLGTHSAFWTVIMTGLDADNSDVHIQWPDQQTPVAVETNSSGVGVVTSPSYPCSGPKQHYVAPTFGTRGTGTKQMFYFKSATELYC